MPSYAESYATVAPFAWRHCLVTLPTGEHHVLVFDFEKTDKAKRERMMATFGMSALQGYAEEKGGKTVWTHETRKPFALVSKSDGDPFVVDERDIAAAYDTVHGWLLLDLQSGAVFFVDTPDGYVPEDDGAAVEVAPSVKALGIKAGKKPAADDA